VNIQLNRTVLTGDSAIHKFLAGRDIWNEYVEQYPEANVDFSGVDFSGASAMTDFFNFLFPKKGDVDFSGAIFGSKGVDFSGAIFGEGHVDFSGTNFGGGRAAFSGTSFGDGWVIFRHSTFGGGDVDFSDAMFGAGTVDFSNTKFADGVVDFSGATFGAGTVDFSNTKFADGDVDFSGVMFGDGMVDFTDTTFSEGMVDFTNAGFGDGGVSFNGASLSKGLISFVKVTFGDVDLAGAFFGDVAMDFKYARFLGHADFSQINKASNISSLSFRHCVFERSLDLSDNRFSCIPDLTNTKLTYQVSLDGLVCKARIGEEGIPDLKDGDRLCRLKEIAESNKNHSQALDFHIQEMRVKRHTLSGLNWFIDTIFDGVSEYGRSVTKPLRWLVRSWYLFGLMYSCLSIYGDPFKSGIEYFWSAFLFSTAQIVPFVAVSRATSKSSAEALFGSDIPHYVFTASLVQGLISFVLLFLVGLALRNRFRI